PRRRTEPGDDLLTALLAAEEAGDRLSHDECVNLVLNVIAGGVDTTQAQLGHALRLFAAHPRQWELLRERPELVPAAVDEVLRAEPITPFTARICLEALEHRGVLFPAGTIVAVCAERANREQDGGEVAEARRSRPRPPSSRATLRGVKYSPTGTTPVNAPRKRSISA